MTSKWTTSAPAASDASTSAPNLAKSALKMEGAIKKSFSGMMSSILTDELVWRGRAAGSVLATSALAVERARATTRDCIFFGYLRAHRFTTLQGCYAVTIRCSRCRHHALCCTSRLLAVRRLS